MRVTILFLFFTLTFISCKKEKNTTTNSTIENKENVLNQGKHCYFSKIENSELVLDATINKDSIVGNYDYYPEKGKPNKGVFKGILNKNIANTICTFTQNDKTVKEEFVFKITNDKVSILGGEKKEINGVWHFTDKNKGVYMNDLPKRNCN